MSKDCLTEKQIFLCFKPKKECRLPPVSYLRSLAAFSFFILATFQNHLRCYEIAKPKPHHVSLGVGLR